MSNSCTCRQNVAIDWVIGILFAMSDITPTLYVKSGCPWCREAVETLQKYKIPYTEVVVSGNREAMKKMVDLSGQSKAPTLDWNGDILADFGAEELVPFLKSKGLI